MDHANPHNSDRSAGPDGQTPQSQGRQVSSECHWLSVEQIRKRERMRRQRVIDAMNSGALSYEQRGRVRYARLADVLRWGDQRVSQQPRSQVTIRTDLADLE